MQKWFVPPLNKQLSDSFAISGLIFDQEETAYLSYLVLKCSEVYAFILPVFWVLSRNYFPLTKQYLFPFCYTLFIILNRSNSSVFIRIFSNTKFFIVKHALYSPCLLLRAFTDFCILSYSGKPSIASWRAAFNRFSKIIRVQLFGCSKCLLSTKMSCQTAFLVESKNMLLLINMLFHEGTVQYAFFSYFIEENEINVFF